MMERSQKGILFSRETATAVVPRIFRSTREWFRLSAGAAVYPCMTFLFHGNMRTLSDVLSPMSTSPTTAAYREAFEYMNHNIDKSSLWERWPSW